MDEHDLSHPSYSNGRTLGPGVRKLRSGKREARANVSDPLFIVVWSHLSLAVRNGSRLQNSLRLVTVEILPT